MNDNQIAHPIEATTERTAEGPESGRVPKAEPDEVEYVANSLERWFRKLRDQVDSLYLCLHDTDDDGRVALGTDDVAKAAMVDAVRCQMEFDHLVRRVRALAEGRQPHAEPNVTSLEALVLERELALARLINNEAAGKLVSLSGDRGMQFAEALDAVNDAKDALATAQAEVAS